MANINCLDGLRCPECGSYEPFIIRGVADFEAYDDGVTLAEDPQIDWYDSSWCHCKNCGYAYQIKSFKESDDA